MQIFKALIATSILMFFSSCHDRNDEIIAKVEGEPIYKSTFTNLLKFEKAKYGTKALQDAQLIETIKKTVLDELIKEKLLYVMAKEDGINVSEEELNQEFARLKSHYTEASFQKMLELKGINYDEWKEDKKIHLTIDKFIQQKVVSNIKITDADIQKYYNGHRRDFTHGDEAHARQVLVDDKNLAETLRAKLVAGENFAAIAQEHSIAPEGKRGGDLGWFGRGIMPKAFDEACFPLPTGGISPIVKTEFGYHIFKVVERRGARTIPLKEVRDKIIVRLQQGYSEDVFNKWYEPIRSSADLEINEASIREIK